MKFRNLFFGLIIAAVTSTQVAVAFANTIVDPPITVPITSPISTPSPTPSPSATPNPSDKFTNLSAEMPYPGQAVFRFNYNGLPVNYFYVNASTTPNMSWDMYWKFAEGFRNPISLTNPTKWDKYSCGRTLYWQVVSITGDKSPIQQTSVTCTSPITVGTFSNLSANLTGNQAYFNFTYSGPSVAGYNVDISTTQDMSWDVYLAFASSNAPAIVLNNPQARWDKYSCGRTLYWRVYDATRRASSSIQASTIQCPSSTPVPTSAPTPQPSSTPITSPSPTPSASSSATPRPTPIATNSARLNPSNPATVTQPTNKPVNFNIFKINLQNFVQTILQ